MSCHHYANASLIALKGCRNLYICSNGKHIKYLIFSSVVKVLWHSRIAFFPSRPVLLLPCMLLWTHRLYLSSFFLVCDSVLWWANLDTLWYDKILDKGSDCLFYIRTTDELVQTMLSVTELIFILSLGVCEMQEKRSLKIVTYYFLYNLTSESYLAFYILGLGYG